MFGPAAVATFENHNAFGSNIGVELFSFTDLATLGNGVSERTQAGKAQPGTAAAVLDWGPESSLDLAAIYHATICDDHVGVNHIGHKEAPYP